MSQYGTPTTGETRIKGSRETDVPGVTESLGTPGLANMPVTPTSGLNAFHELSTALGLVGQDAALYAEQQLQERNRQDRFNAHAEQIDHAKALEHAESILPGLASQVADGKVSVWNDKNGESQSSQQAEFWAESIAGSGSDAYSTKLRSALAPHLAKVLEQAREKKLNTAAIETAKDSRTLVYTPLSPDGSEPTNAGTDYVKPTTNADDPPVSTWRGGSVPSNVGELIDSGYSKVQSRLTRDQYIALSVMPAIRMAGKNGDTAAIDELAKHVPDSFADSVENARLAAARTEAVRASQQSKAVDHWIGDAEYAAMNGDGDFQTARDRVDRAFSSGLIDSQDAIRRRTSIDIKERELLGQNKGLLEKIQEAQIKDNAVKATREHIGQGGSAGSVQDFKFLTPTGEEKTIHAKELLGDAVQADFDLIDQNALGRVKAIEEMDASPEYKQQKLAETQQQSMAQKVRRLQKSGDTYQPWAKIISTMPTIANQEMLAQQGPLPPDVQNAIALRDRIPDDLFYRMASPDSRHFWHTLDTTRELVTGTQPENIRQALVETNRHMAGDPVAAEIRHNNIAVSNRLIRESADSAFGTDIKSSFVYREIGIMSRYYMSEPYNASEDKAIQMATNIVKQNTTIMGKYAVPTLGVHVPENLSMASPLLLEEFVARNPKLGLTADDLSLRPYDNGSWMVVRGEHADSPVMIPVETFPEDGLFTAKQIDDMLPGLMTRAKARSQKERADAWHKYSSGPALRRGTGRNILD